jgi:hypothetical protein
MGKNMSLESADNQQNQAEEAAAAADNASTAPFRQQLLHASRTAEVKKSATYARPCMIVFGSFWGLLKVGQGETKDIFVQRLKSQSKHRENHLAMVYPGMLEKGQMVI